MKIVRPIDITDFVLTDSNVREFHGGVWTSSGALTVARQSPAGSGTQTAALAMGGQATGTFVFSAVAEKGNGTTWTATGSLNTARSGLAAAGTQSATVAFGGRTGSTTYVTTTELFNGATWSASGALGTARAYLAGCGVSTAALGVGGTVSGPANSAVTSLFNGSTWSVGASLNTARTGLAAAGIQSAAISFGGYDSTYATVSEIYDGTTWKVGPGLTTPRTLIGGFGSASSALSFGGENGSGLRTTTEDFDGAAWSSAGALATAREAGAASGNSTGESGISFGGYAAGAVSAVTETYTANGATPVDYPGWDPATTYADGDRVTYITATSTGTITIGAPAVITLAEYVRPVGARVSFTTTGALPTGISAGVTYYVVRVTGTHSFTVSLTPGGPEIITSGSQSGTHTATTHAHAIYESQTGSNIGHNPLSEPSVGTTIYWVEVGPTNRWKMFDQSITSQAANSNTVSLILNPGARVDSVVLLNIDAASVRITVTDATDGTVYDKTTSLVSDSGVTDWYAYFFEPIDRVANFAATDLPPYANPTITVLLSDSGNTVLLGGCVLGLSRDFSSYTQQNSTLGILDYSVKKQDDFGNYNVLERAFSKKSELFVWVPNNQLDAFQKTLETYRATPVVYIGSDSFASTIIYGFYRDFTNTLAQPDFTLCDITLEGLT